MKIPLEPLETIIGEAIAKYSASTHRDPKYLIVSPQVYYELMCQAEFYTSLKTGKQFYRGLEVIRRDYDYGPDIKIDS